MELRWFSNDYHGNHNCLSECNQWGSTIINNYDHRMAITIIYHWSNYNCFSSFLHWLCQPGQSTRSRIINPANTPPWTHLYTHTHAHRAIYNIYIYLFIYLYLYLYMCTLIPSYPQAAWFAVLLFDTVVVGLGWGGLGLGEWGFGGVGGGAITFQEATSWAIAGGLAIDWCCGCYVDAGSLQLVATLMFPCYVFRMGLICWC